MATKNSFGLITFVIVTSFTCTSARPQIVAGFKPMNPGYHPIPGDHLQMQIIPPGKPWPASAEGYANFSQTTSSPSVPSLGNRIQDTVSGSSPPKQSTSSSINKEYEPIRPFHNPSGAGYLQIQIIPPGKPWPASADEYANFSQTTSPPTSSTSKPSLDNRFQDTSTTSKKPSQETIDKLTALFYPLKPTSASNIFTKPTPLVTEETTSKRNDFMSTTAANKDKTTEYAVHTSTTVNNNLNELFNSPNRVTGIFLQSEGTLFTSKSQKTTPIPKTDLGTTTTLKPSTSKLFNNKIETTTSIISRDSTTIRTTTTSEPSTTTTTTVRTSEIPTKPSTFKTKPTSTSRYTTEGSSTTAKPREEDDLPIVSNLLPDAETILSNPLALGNRINSNTQTVKPTAETPSETVKPSQTVKPSAVVPPSQTFRPPKKPKIVITVERLDYIQPPFVRYPSFSDYYNPPEFPFNNPFY